MLPCSSRDSLNSVWVTQPTSRVQKLVDEAMKTEKVPEDGPASNRMRPKSSKKSMVSPQLTERVQDICFTKLIQEKCKKEPKKTVFKPHPTPREHNDSQDMNILCFGSKQPLDSRKQGCFMPMLVYLRDQHQSKTNQ